MWECCACHFNFLHVRQLMLSEVNYATTHLHAWDHNSTLPLGRAIPAPPVSWMWLLHFSCGAPPCSSAVFSFELNGTNVSALSELPLSCSFLLHPKNSFCASCYITENKNGCSLQKTFSALFPCAMPRSKLDVIECSCSKNLSMDKIEPFFLLWKNSSL